MESPGEILREARRRSGLNPQEIYRLTRVRPALLEAMEEDLLSALPEAPYARSLFSTVARVVGADVPQVVAAYDRLHASRTVVAIPLEPAPSPSRIPHAGLLVWIAVLIFLIAILLVVGRGGWSSREGSGRPARPPATTEAPAGASGVEALGSSPLVARGVEEEGLAGEESAGGMAGGAGAAEAGLEGRPAADSPPVALLPGERALAGPGAQVDAIETEAGAAGVESGAAALPGGVIRPRVLSLPTDGDAGVSTLPGAAVLPLASDSPAEAEAVGPRVQGPQPEEMTLSVLALDDTWVRVAADGRRIRSGILPRGETRVWRGRQELRLDIGSASGLSMTINGRRVEIPGPRVGTLHLSFTPDLFQPPQPPPPAGSPAPTGP